MINTWGQDMSSEASPPHSYVPALATSMIHITLVNNVCQIPTWCLCDAQVNLQKIDSTSYKSLFFILLRYSAQERSFSTYSVCKS